MHLTDGQRTARGQLKTTPMTIPRHSHNYPKAHRNWIANASDRCRIEIAKGHGSRHDDPFGLIVSYTYRPSSSKINMSPPSPTPRLRLKFLGSIGGRVYIAELLERKKP